MANPRGQMVDTSHSDGLGVQATWALLLSQNELRWRALPLGVPPLDDAALAAEMRRRFPGREESKSMGNPKKARREYNRGAYGAMPRYGSFAYRVEPPTVTQVTARGTALEIKACLLKSDPLESEAMLGEQR